MTMTEVHSEVSPSRQLDGTGNQYLTFLLGGEEYGVDILRVQEIKGWDRATPIPNTASYVLGVINLRGAVVPIIDLRLRFQMPQVEYTKTTVVMVLRVQAGNTERTMGFVVDAVSDVYSVADDQLRPKPDLGRAGEAHFVKSLATVDGKMVILLDIDQLVDLSAEAPAEKN
jgi:purine-binding chemotaxis protein CheW